LNKNYSGKTFWDYSTASPQF